MIFESHAHYDDTAFDTDREALLKQCQEQGIETIVKELCNALENISLLMMK